MTEMYRCPRCGQAQYFEASACGSCGTALGYHPSTDTLLGLEPATGGWVDGAGNSNGATLCRNSGLGECNWLVESGADNGYCRACRHNRTIPDLGVPGVIHRWRKIEVAKRRLIRSLIAHRLPLEVWTSDVAGLGFDFLYDASAEQAMAPSVHTGHSGGLITINLIEADDAARERIRQQMGEPYRTLLGHFRHEVAHHYWDRLVANSGWLDEFRGQFGDERADYQTALQAYYASGAPADWSDRFVSAYASSHPWEDFAETFAHYLHICATLSTLARVGGSFDAPSIGEGRIAINFDPHKVDTATLVRNWMPISFALNIVNRSMGQPDLYPFRLTMPVVLKLDFCNRLVADAGGLLLAPSDVTGLRAMVALLDQSARVPLA